MKRIDIYYDGVFGYEQAALLDKVADILREKFSSPFELVRKSINQLKEYTEGDEKVGNLIIIPGKYAAEPATFFQLVENKEWEKLCFDNNIFNIILPIQTDVLGFPIEKNMGIGKVEIILYHPQSSESITVAIQSASEQGKQILIAADKNNLAENTIAFLQKPNVKLMDIEDDNLLEEIKHHKYDIIISDNANGKFFYTLLGHPLYNNNFQIAVYLCEKGQKLYSSFIQPVHVSSAGDLINPYGYLKALSKLLSSLDFEKESQTLSEAVNWVYQNGFVTKDIDPFNHYSTSTIYELVCDYITENISALNNKERFDLQKSTII